MYIRHAVYRRQKPRLQARALANPYGRAGKLRWVTSRPTRRQYHCPPKIDFELADYQMTESTTGTSSVPLQPNYTMITLQACLCAIKPRRPAANGHLIGTGNCYRSVVGGGKKKKHPLILVTTGQL